MKLHEKIKIARIRAGYTQKALADLFGVTRSAIYLWEKSKEEKGTAPGADKLHELANLFHVNVNDLLDDAVDLGNGDMISDVDKLRYPRVIGTAKMGDGGYYVDLEGGDGYVEFESATGSVAIRVRGDSMYPAIRDGWYVILEPNSELQLGEYVLVAFTDGKKMVKELLQIEDDCYVLESVKGNERITAFKADIENIRHISAIVSPSKHKPF